MLVLDGSYGEGSGAVLRTAIAMSALTVQPVRIENVRGALANPGLNGEDLAIIRALAETTQAELVGAESGSLQLSFLPTRTARPYRGHLSAPAGGPPEQANALVMATALAPVLAKAGGMSSFEVTGETFGRNVLGFDAFDGCTLPAWKKLGLYTECDLVEAGFGLRSQGLVRVEIEPSALSGVGWTDRGALLTARAIVSMGQLPSAIAERGASHLNRLAQSSGIPLDAELNLLESETPGAHVTVLGEFERGFGSCSASGARGIRIESVCQQAFEGFLDWYRSDATVDAFLADQLILLCVVAEGDTILKVHRLTERLLSMIWVIKQFVPIHITVKGQRDKPGTISVKR